MPVPSAPPASYQPDAGTARALAASPAPTYQPSPAPSWQSAPSTQLAYATAPARLAPSSVQSQPAPKARKVWLQLASGQNPAALPGQFKRLKSRNSELFDGIKGYVAKGPDRSRLVIGPFRGSSDAEIFQQDLESVGIDAFSWTNSESDTIVPLGTE